MLAGAKRTTKTLITAASCLAFLIFAVNNREVAHVSLFPLPFAADMPLFLFAVLCFFLGTLGGCFCCAAKGRRLGAQLKAEQALHRAVQNQLDALRAERAASAPPAAPAPPPASLLP